VASLPAYGHLYPMLPLALACRAAGHDVVVAVGEPFHGRLPLPTRLGLSRGLTLHDLEQEVFTNHPDILATPVGFPKALFGESTPKRVVPVLLDLFDREPPDLVVHEVTNIGAAIAADLAGAPSIAFGLGLWFPMVPEWYATAAADHAYRWHIREREPGPLGELPGGYLDPMPPSMQDPGPLPANRQPIRSVPWAPAMPPLPWLAAPRRRPRVYLTLGTVSYGAVDVLRRAVTETAAHDVDVLVAVGPAGDPTLLGELPANVHTERFVSQAAVLAAVDVAVHHGGAGTTLGALASGVPQLLLPQGADHPFNAAALVRAGAGRALPNEEQTPGAIGAAVAALLADGPERQAAKRIQAEIAALPSPIEVAVAL
jgi:UDP:flavonoid glycosyltransferase YjiC (YdhE family)